MANDETIEPLEYEWWVEEKYTVCDICGEPAEGFVRPLPLCQVLSYVPRLVRVSVASARKRRAVNDRHPPKEGTANGRQEGS